MEEEIRCSLPSPADTPYRTPSSSVSRRSQRYESMSPSSSPPPLPSDDRSSRRRSNDSINPALDESISPLDPRRFTPTLHASLVSEILSLRRDLEGKTMDIDQLENNLHVAQRENERLNETLHSTNKESRSLKRQMQLLEGGTMNALNDLAKERDDAMGDLADMRKRLDQSQKRAKSHEDNAERTQSLLDREKEAWVAEKRSLETKVNIVEGRLKVVLSEVAIQQFTSNPFQNGDLPRQQMGSIPESPGKRSTSALSRRYSGASINSDQLGGRMSALGHAHGLSGNLADELALDEEEEEEDPNEVPEDGRISPDALPEELDRPTSRLSVKAHRILGLSIGIEENGVHESPKRRESPKRYESPKRHRAFGFFTAHEEHPVSTHQAISTVRYVDAGVQHSPLPEPQNLPSLSASGILKMEVTPIEPALAIFSGPRQSLNEPVSPVSIAESVESRDIPWKSKTLVSAPVMTSTSCQTVELLPSPPLTPEMTNSEFLEMQEDIPDKVVMASASTQTEPIENKGVSDESRSIFQDVRKLPIPTIAIIPPGSRPATPETSVVLPPRTKNAGCQVSMQFSDGYCSSGMQTEEIKIDRRKMDLPPLSTASIMSQYKPPILAKNIPSNSSRRRFPLTAPPSNMYDSRRAMIEEEPLYPPGNDSGPLVKDFAPNSRPINRPSRSSSLFAGFEDQKEEEFARFDDDIFDEDDIFSRPTAKFTVKAGKLVQEPGLEDIGEMAAASAGEAIALENLRMSEDGLPPEIRSILAGRTSPRKKSVDSGTRSYKQTRRVPSPKRHNIRRAALISSGTAAHSAQSSVRSSHEFTTPVDGAMAPFPVPIRFSSARIGKSTSEGGRSSPASSAASPTKRERNRSRKPLLRKVRSGPAVSPGPNGRRPRSRSPPNPRVSIIPDIPSFQMPADNVSIKTYQTYQPSEASAPRPSIATGPNRNRSHTKTTSDAVSIHQTSVVDAIAQTMIGEWMFKYVRRRKSFGMPDAKATAEYDPNKNPDEISATVTSTGVRHKRWVWLAPYERSVMWSSKQPTSNTALLGKSGRKLTIQSVLDVKDDNPMPKGSITGQHFNRSILILTPQRALKFTALTQDRHYVWLTALSFLSHSPLSLGDLAALPPPPSADAHGTSSLPPASLAGSLRRRPIRDSIRLAKGTTRTAGLRSFTTDGSLPVQVQDLTDREQRHAEEQGFYDPLMDAALPPTIPRFSTHSRNRSNTAPRAPPTSFKSFSAKEREAGNAGGNTPSLPVSVSGVGSTYSQSVGTGVGSERGLYTPSLGMVSKSSSRRGSEASVMSGGRPNPGLVGMYVDSVNGGGGNNTSNNVNIVNNINAGNFGNNTAHSNAPGQYHPNPNWTMRMDAFIDTRPAPSRPPQPPQQSSVGGFFRSRHNGKKKDLGYWGVEDDGRNASTGLGMESILMPGDVFGSTRMGFNHGQEVEVGSGDLFRGF